MEWAIVLAGGEGRRLASEATEKYGYARPKQFCAFFGHTETLVEATVRRAATVVPHERIAVVTTAPHRAEADACLAGFSKLLRVEQPANRDTLPGLLLPLIEVLQRDPDAIVYVLPADHYVDSDHGFMATLRQAAWSLGDEVVLAGAIPEGPEPGYGWIVPREGEGLWARVARFVEKPAPAEVTPLIAGGALVNTFAMVARARVLRDLIASEAPEWDRALQQAVGDPTALAEVYAALPSANVSHEVLERHPEQLRVVPLREVAWSDVGTPERLDRAKAADAA